MDVQSVITDFVTSVGSHFQPRLSTAQIVEIGTRRWKKVEQP